MCILGPLFFPQNSQKWVSLGFRASSAPQNTQKWVNFTQKWANSDLRTSFSRKTLRKAQIWALGPLFFSHRNSQKWANGHFMAFFFHPKTPRNGSVWVSGPLSPQEHSEMGKFGLQGLYFIFYPQNTQKWANSAFRASFSPQERSEMGQFGSQGLFYPKNTRKWVRLALRTSISPQSGLKLSFRASSPPPPSHRNGSIHIFGPFPLTPNP